MYLMAPEWEDETHLDDYLMLSAACQRFYRAFNRIRIIDLRYTKIAVQQFNLTINILIE